MQYMNVAFVLDIMNMWYLPLENRKFLIMGHRILAILYCTYSGKILLSSIFYHNILVHNT